MQATEGVLRPAAHYGLISLSVAVREDPFSSAESLIAAWWQQHTHWGSLLGQANKAYVG